MRSKIPSLTALKSFEAAARHGSFRDAADELCVSHSAVSHQIKQLESSLQVELFERKSRAVSLSKRGKLYYPVIRDAFDRIAEGTDLLLAPQSPGILTLQLYSTFAIRWLIPRLQKFYSTHPDIKVRINTSQNDVDFIHDDVDLCVLIGNRSSADIHYDYLFTPQLFPVASPTLLSNIDITSPEQLAQQTILQVYPSDKDWYLWLDGVGAHGVDPESGLQFDSYDHALSTASQGLGIALGMQPYVARDLRAGFLVELFAGQRVTAAGEWYLACRRDKADCAKIANFRRWLLQEIKEDSDLSDARKDKNKPI